MSLSQLLERMWAQRYFALFSAILCMIAAIVVVAYLPERYIATAPIQLETRIEANAQQYSINSRQIDTFVQSQAEMAKHPSVTGLVVDKLRWTESYELAEQYRQSGAAQDKDFRTWLADLIAERIVLNFTEGSPSFTLSYVGLSPGEAETMAGLLQEAYIENSMLSSRTLASDQEARLEQQLEKLRSRMQDLEARNTEFGRRNDVVLNADGISVTEIQMRAAAGASFSHHGSPQAVASVPPMFERQLEELDGEIARLSLTLGPNHPKLLRLKTEREEFARSMPEPASIAATPQGPSSEDIQRQREQEYLAKADAIATAKRYDAELKALERRFAALAEQRQYYALDSAIQRPTASSGGAVALEGGVYYPRAKFAIIGAAAFGAILGLLIGLLSSLLNLRVRSAKDLQSLGIKVLGTKRAAGPKSRTIEDSDLVPAPA